MQFYCGVTFHYFLYFYVLHSPFILEGVHHLENVRRMNSNQATAVMTVGRLETPLWFKALHRTLLIVNGVGLNYSAKDVRSC